MGYMVEVWKTHSDGPFGDDRDSYLNTVNIERHRWSIKIVNHAQG